MMAHNPSQSGTSRRIYLLGAWCCHYHCYGLDLLSVGLKVGHRKLYHRHLHFRVLQSLDDCRSAMPSSLLFHFWRRTSLCLSRSGPDSASIDCRCSKACSSELAVSQRGYLASQSQLGTHWAVPPLCNRQHGRLRASLRIQSRKERSTRGPTKWHRTLGRRYAAITRTRVRVLDGNRESYGKPPVCQWCTGIKMSSVVLFFKWFLF